MSNVHIVLTEYFHAQTEEQRQENLQAAVDRYIHLMLERADDTGENGL